MARQNDLPLDDEPSPLPLHDKPRRSGTLFDRLLFNVFVPSVSLLSLGALAAVYGLSMNTTVQVGHEHIHNYGLLVNKICIVILGGLAFVAGAIFRLIEEMQTTKRQKARRD